MSPLHEMSEVEAKHICTMHAVRCSRILHDTFICYFRIIAQKFYEQVMNAVSVTLGTEINLKITGY